MINYVITFLFAFIASIWFWEGKFIVNCKIYFKWIHMNVVYGGWLGSLQNEFEQKTDLSKNFMNSHPFISSHFFSTLQRLLIKLFSFTFYFILQIFERYLSYKIYCVFTTPKSNHNQVLIIALNESGTEWFLNAREKCLKRKNC